MSDNVSSPAGESFSGPMRRICCSVCKQCWDRLSFYSVSSFLGSGKMLDRLAMARAQFHFIRDRLRGEDPGLDEVTLIDTLEGLTDLHEMLAAVVRSALLDEALAAGLSERIGEMQRRH